MIDLYTAPTPNGWKASITLEELEIPYEVHRINLLARAMQKKPWYLKSTRTVGFRPSSIATRAISRSSSRARS